MSPSIRTSATPGAAPISTRSGVAPPRDHARPASPDAAPLSRRSPTGRHERTRMPASTGPRSPRRRAGLTRGSAVPTRTVPLDLSDPAVFGDVGVQRHALASRSVSRPGRLMTSHGRCSRTPTSSTPPSCGAGESPPRHGCRWPASSSRRSTGSSGRSRCSSCPGSRRWLAAHPGALARRYPASRLAGRPPRARPTLRDSTATAARELIEAVNVQTCTPARRNASTQPAARPGAHPRARRTRGPRRAEGQSAIGGDVLLVTRAPIAAATAPRPRSSSYAWSRSPPASSRSDGFDGAAR